MGNWYIRLVSDINMQQLLINVIEICGSFLSPLNIFGFLAMDRQNLISFLSILERTD